MTKASRVLAAPEDGDAAGPDNLDLVREFWRFQIGFPHLSPNLLTNLRSQAPRLPS